MFSTASLLLNETELKRDSRSNLSVRMADYYYEQPQFQL